MNETQIFVNLILETKEILSDCYGAFVASAALIASEIPFENPISEVRVARIDGEYVINPSKTALADADMNFIIGGSMDNIVMVEGESSECQEEDLIEAIKIAHEAIKQQCQLQLDLRSALGIKSNREVPASETNEDLEKEIQAYCSDKILKIASSSLGKFERKQGFNEIKDELKEHLLEQHGEEYMEENAKFVSSYFYDTMKNTIREMLCPSKFVWMDVLLLRSEIFGVKLIQYLHHTVLLYLIVAKHKFYQLLRWGLN